VATVPAVFAARARGSESDRSSHRPSPGERDRAMKAYVAGSITVEELLAVLDRQDNWIERIIRHMSAYPAPVERAVKRLTRAG